MLDLIVIFFLHIASNDVWYYIIHRAMHTRHLYFLHKKHHATLPNKITLRDAYKGELVEFPLETAGVIVPLFFKKEADYAIFFVAFIFIVVRNLLQHDKRFAKIVGSHHLLHHTYPNYNFGEPWLDRVFSTTYYKKNT